MCSCYVLEYRAGRSDTELAGDRHMTPDPTKKLEASLRQGRDFAYQKRGYMRIRMITEGSDRGSVGVQCTAARSIGAERLGAAISALTPHQFLWLIRRAREEGLLPLEPTSQAACARDHQLYDKH